MDSTIRKYVLQNAIKFKGKANPGAIIGKVIAENPKADKKELAMKINAIVKSVNSLSNEEQLKELQELAPELLEKKEKEERNIFAFLNIKDKITTAFPPGPEKYPHIGHAKAILLNYMLAKQYNGKFILRFEDTNPKTAKKEFYDVMEDNFKWLGIKWDEKINASDYMETFYEKCEELIKKGLAYIDKTSQEEVKLSREKGIETSYRNNDIETNLKLWKEMKDEDEGNSIVRLKIDLKHQNSTMRDPTIFRIIKEEHPIQKNKYSIWPNYDFQNSIMDSITGVDIRLRSKEFELRSELQRWIQSNLNIRETKTYEFGRFNMTGVVSSGRIIREKVENKELIGWDDPSLTTLVALRRRGFLPKAIENFVISTGLSKAEATMTWDDLIMHNKRLLDKEAKRFSGIENPIEIEVKDAPNLEVELHLDPNEKKGGRKFQTTNSFILAKNDLDNIKEGDIIRLMDCLNITKKDNEIIYHSKEFVKGCKVINWLPNKNNYDITVLMPDKKIKKLIAEHNISNLNEGEIIQFERFGFCKLDNKEKLEFWFTHG